MNRDSGCRVSAAPYLDVWGTKRTFKRRIQEPLPLPHTGEYILINEQYIGYVPYDHEDEGACGGRRRMLKRYFGKVTSETPALVIIQTVDGRITTEMKKDFRLGFIRFLSLSCLPENAKDIPYDERLIDTFADAFESLLVSISNDY